MTGILFQFTYSVHHLACEYKPQNRAESELKRSSVHAFGMHDGSRFDVYEEDLFNQATEESGLDDNSVAGYMILSRRRAWIHALHLLQEPLAESQIHQRIADYLAFKPRDSRCWDAPEALPLSWNINIER